MAPALGLRGCPATKGESAERKKHGSAESGSKQPGNLEILGMLEFFTLTVSGIGGSSALLIPSYFFCLKTHLILADVVDIS